MAFRIEQRWKSDSTLAVSTRVRTRACAVVIAPSRRLRDDVLPDNFGPTSSRQNSRFVWNASIKNTRDDTRFKTRVSDERDGQKKKTSA